MSGAGVVPIFPAISDFIKALAVQLPVDGTVTEERLDSFMYAAESTLRFLYQLPHRERIGPASFPACDHQQEQPAAKPAFLSEALLFIMAERKGETLHCNDVYEQAMQLGARPSSGLLPYVVDSTFRGLRKRGEPLERVGPFLWRWTGEP